MQLKLRLLLSITLVVVFSFLSVFAFGQTTPTYSQTALPTVSSDKDDYAPGEVAIIRGTGWTLDQYVDVHIEEEPTQVHVHDYHDTKVNPDGTWEIRYPIEDRHLGVKFTLIVEGKQSGYEARAYFTDSRSDYTSTLSKTEVCSGIGFTLALKNVSNVPVGTGNETNRTFSSFKIIIPSDVTLIPESVSGWTISTATPGEIRYSTTTNAISSGNSVIVPLKATVSTTKNVTIETRVYTSNNFTSNNGSQPEFILTTNNNSPTSIYPNISIIRLPNASISGSATINSGDNATLSVALTGTSPWSLSYSNGTTNTTINGISSSPHTFTVSPTTNTTYTLISLSDANCSAVAEGLTGSATITVNANQPPSLNAIGSKNIDELETLSFTATASDENVLGLSYSLQGSVPDGAVITSAGVFSWTPGEDQDGSHSITIRVTDNGSPAKYDEETITVTVNEVNLAPTLAAIGNKSVNELVALTFTAVGADGDAGTGAKNTLAYSLVGAPSGASIDPATGAFTWTPTEAQDGQHTFTVKVTDNGSPALSASEEITVTVNEVNLAPTLAAIGNKATPWGTKIEFTASATDVDKVAGVANTKTYSLETIANSTYPTGATINSSTGAFEWTPIQAQGPGTYKVKVVVTDNGNPVFNDYEDVTIVVGKRETFITYEGDGSEQYSDLQQLSAKLVDKATNAVIASKTVLFKIAGQAEVSGTTNASGIATASQKVELAPANNYSIAVKFEEDDYYTGSTTSFTPFVVNVEDVEASYSGTLFANTASTANDSKAQINLKAYLVEAKDGSLGDITKATVSFVVTNAYNGTSVGTYPATVVIAKDINGNEIPGEGVAEAAVWEPTLGAALSETYNVRVIVNGYYVGEDEAQVTVSKPSSDFVTGGGYIIPKNTDPNTGANLGRKNNFGFSIKYNNKMTNLQGNFNTQIRRGTKFYHVKSNSPSSITITSRTAPYTASITYQNVVIQEVVNGVVVWSLGNNTVVLDVTDLGEGSNVGPDEISMTIRDKSGKLWYANNLVSSKPAKQPLNGGNIQVRLGTTTTQTQQVVTEARAVEVLEPVSREFSLKAFPNPSVSSFKVQVSSDRVSEKIAVRVLDLYGRTVEVIPAAYSGQTLTIGAAYRPGIYFVEMIQGTQRKQIKLIKQAE